jgi:hypothetical protein
MRCKIWMRGESGYRSPSILPLSSRFRAAASSSERSGALHSDEALNQLPRGHKQVDRVVRAGLVRAAATKIVLN